MQNDQSVVHEHTHKLGPKITHNVVWLFMSFIFVAIVVISIWFVNAPGGNVFKGIIGGLIFTFAFSFCFIRVGVDNVLINRNSSNIQDNGICDHAPFPFAPLQMPPYNIVPPPQGGRLAPAAEALTPAVPSVNLNPPYTERAMIAPSPAQRSDVGPPPSYEEVMRDMKKREAQFVTEDSAI